ncbi:MAG: ABC transporter permease [Methanoculleaceae archaeon]
MNARHIRIIAMQELRGLSQERTIVSAIFLQLFIALFSSSLVVGLVAMYDPAALGPRGTEFEVAVCGSGDRLVDLLDARPDIHAVSVSLGAGLEALEEGRIAAVVNVPDTPPDAYEPLLITVWLNRNDIRSSIVAASLREPLQTLEQELRNARSERLEHRVISPEFPERPSGGRYFEFVFGLLVPVLLFLPAVVSGAIVIDSITEEFQQKTLETLLSTPISFADLLRGKVLAAYILVPVQAGAWLLLLAANGIRTAAPVEVLLHISIIALDLILAGAVIALHYRERTAAQFVFSILLVTLLFAVLAVPANPVNMVVRLAVGSAGAEHWLMLGAEAAVALQLAVMTAWLARRSGRPDQLRKPDAGLQET